MLRIPLCLLASIALAGSARSQLLYHTSFETPNYAVGQSIDGVDGWFSFISPNANQIAHGFGTAGFGRRAVTCWGGSPDLESTQGLLDGAWARPASVNPAYGNHVLVHVSCNVRLDGPDTGSGPQDDLLSANLIARNGVGGSAYMYMSSVGEVFCFADSANGSTGYAFATPITLGAYATLGITLNYSNHMATFWVGHVPVGSLPFGGQATEHFNGATLEFAAYDNLAYVDPSLYRGYWDDLTMFAIPIFW